MTAPIRPAARLAGLRPYQAEARDASITMRLDANEGVAPSGSVMAALAAITAEDLHRYADASSLEQRIAQRLSIDASRVVVTNGGDDAIDRVCRAVLEPGRDLLTHAPGFVMIPRSAQLAGADVRSVVWIDSPFPTDALIEMIDNTTGLVALVSPNNPTGGVIAADELCTIARAAARSGALAMIDLAYAEFADHDPCERLLDEPNAVIVRTMSKAFGLAGIRVGYAIASPEVAAWLRTAGGPYPVSSPAASLAARALDTELERAAFIDRVRHERAELITLLRDLGACPLDSQANFVCARFDDAANVHRSLVEQGILVRAFPATPSIEDALRISLPGSADHFDRLCRALRAILSSSVSR